MDKKQPAEQQATCTNSDSWNCKYCNKTKTCAALAAGQAAAAKAVVPPNAITASVMRDDGGEAPAFCLMAAYRSEKDAMDAFALIAAAPAQPAAQQGAAYAALPDEGEPWRGHKFKEVQRGCWRCDCGKTIKEVTSDQSTPASGGNYPVMPKRYTVDDDGEELFTAEKMRAFADATHTLRASHGEAPAQPDQPIACSYGDNGYACCEGGPCQADVHNDKLAEQQAPATAQAEESVPAPAPPPECETEAEKRAFAFGWFKALESERRKADSVQEDAARYRLLRRGQHWSVIDAIGNDLLRAEALDAAVDAARKQGGL